MTRDVRTARFAAALTIAALGAPAAAQPVVDLAVARSSLVGQWQGKLEYLDYRAGKWFGIPVKTVIEDQGDGATTIRRSDFDDGPTTGIVRITTVELFDPAKAAVTVGTFRKGRSVDVSTYTARLVGAPRDATRWTVVEETKGSDDNRPAMLRLTTTRNGDALETLKEVDFLDDEKVVWLTRNRTRLTRRS